MGQQQLTSAINENGLKGDATPGVMGAVFPSNESRTSGKLFLPDMAPSKNSAVNMNLSGDPGGGACEVGVFRGEDGGVGSKNMASTNSSAGSPPEASTADAIAELRGLSLIDKVRVRRACVVLPLCSVSTCASWRSAED